MRAYTAGQLQREFDETIQLARSTGESSFCKRYTREDIPNIINTLALRLGIRKEELVKKFDESIAERRSTAGGQSRKYPGFTAWFVYVATYDVPMIIISNGQPQRRTDV